jgi:hypothetical protein
MKHSRFAVCAAFIITASALPSAWAAPSQQAYVKPSNTPYANQFGYAVAASGDIMVIGAPFETSLSSGVNGNQTNGQNAQIGAAYVFVRNGTNWVQEAYLKASNNVLGLAHQFGTSVSISGNTIVVGAPAEYGGSAGVNGDQFDFSVPNSGAAYVFVRSGTNWSQQAYLKASNTGNGDNFGKAVSISGDTIIVGAYNEDSNATGVNGVQTNNLTGNSGAAYVFVRSGTNWSQQAYLKASNTALADYFGYSVSVFGDTAVVGAWGESSINSDSGAAYIFARSGTNWSQQAYLRASNAGSAGANNEFGFAVSVAGNIVVVGAPYESSSATGVNGNQTNINAFSSGAVYVFARDGATWTQEAYLKASNTGNNDYFGTSVFLSGDTLAVGASGEDSNAIGIGGDGSNNLTASSGAAYVFTRKGSLWSQQAYVKPSNTDTNDQFGIAVAMSGDTLVVGAYGEDSNATGINGNQANNSAGNSGAAYVYAGLGIGPRLSLSSDGTGGYYLRFNGIPDLSYRLQRATNVAGPWDTIDTQTASAFGLIEYHETTPLSSGALYRTVHP